MKARYVVVIFAAIAALAVAGNALSWALRPAVDSNLESYVPGSVVVATPPGHRLTAKALADWIATPLGAHATITRIVTWTGGHTEGDGGKAAPGLETNFVGTLSGGTRGRYTGFYGCVEVNRGEPGYAVDVALDDVNITDADLAKLGAGDREKVRGMLGSLLAAAGIAGDYSTVTASDMRFDHYTGKAYVPGPSKDATPVLVGIAFSDGLIPGDASLQTNCPATHD